MANVRATIDLNVVGSAISLNPALKIFLPNHNEAIAELVPDTRTSTSFINNYPPSYPSRNVNGIDSSSYFDDFYFKIRYLPDTLNIGAITGGQQRDLYVFNGFLEDKTLNNINLQNAAGISINGPSVPALYNPLELSQYQITVDISGPATINAIIAFDWELGIPDKNVSILGTRIILFPYLFNQGTLENLSWKTKVITSNNGKEQRMRIRNSPRQGFDVNVHIPKSDWTISDTLLYGWRGNIWGAPVFSEKRKLSGPINIGDSVINVNTDFGNFKDGGLAVVWRSSQKFEIIQILTFTQNQITLVQPTSQSFFDSDFVAPVIPCRMLGNPIRQTSGSNVRVKARFESIENNTLNTTPSAIQYKGIDVFLDEQLTDGGFVPDAYNRRVDTLDYPSSNVETFSPWNATKIERSFNLIFDNLEQLWNFRLFLHRRAGKLLPFWVPTYENNFNILNTGIILSQLTVLNEGQDIFGPDRKHIGILANGQWSFAEISSFNAVGENIILDLVETLNVQADDISLACYIGIKRLTSDEIQIVHGQNFTSSTTLQITEIGR